MSRLTMARLLERGALSWTKTALMELSRRGDEMSHRVEQLRAFGGVPGAPLSSRDEGFDDVAEASCRLSFETAQALSQSMGRVRVSLHLWRSASRCLQAWLGVNEHGVQRVSLPARLALERYRQCATACLNLK